MIGFTLRQNGIEIASETVKVNEALGAFGCMFREVNRPQLTIIELSGEMVQMRYDSFTAVPQSLTGRFIVPPLAPGKKLVLLHSYRRKAAESDIAFETFVTVVKACASCHPEIFNFQSDSVPTI